MGQGKRSFWGWGYADRFMNSQARKNLGGQLNGLLGFSPTQHCEPPAMSAAMSSVASTSLKVPAQLASVCSTTPEDRVMHTYGRAYRDIVRGFYGDFSPAPDCVAMPHSEQDIIQVLDWADQERVAVVPYGGGTSVVGGVEANPGKNYKGVVALDMGHLNHVCEVDVTSRAARIEAGTMGPRLEEQLAPHGLTLRHFPQSFEFSTLGGWIATRAGGHFAMVYTHIDDLVESIRMVTPRGVVASRRLPGSGAGPSPDRLMLGSEGTLGVITEAWMRVRPRPAFRARAAIEFESYEAAVAATRALSQSGLYPSNCRLLDKREALLNAVSFEGKHILLVGFESADLPVEHWMNSALELSADHGGQCPKGAVYRSEADDMGQSDAAGTWRKAFIDAPYLQTNLVSLGIIADTFETACTWDRFETLHQRVIHDVRAAMKRVCGAGFISCRFTHVYPDGPAPYFTFIAPAKPASELSQWAEIKSAASEAIMACGGSITHHHAVGRTHRPWYDRQRPDLFADALRAAKKTMDPSGILNPGVLIDP